MTATAESNGKHTRSKKAEQPKDRPLPCDPAAEAGAIGAIRIAPELFSDVAAIMSAGDCLDEANVIAFRTMSAMSAEGIGIDAVTFRSRLKAEGLYDAFGGDARLAELSQQVGRLVNAKHYAETVRELSARRQTILAAQALLAHVMSLGATISSASKSGGWWTWYATTS